MGRNATASADCTEALRIEPSNAQADTKRGMRLTSIGMHIEAVADCDETIRLLHKFGLAYVGRSIAYHLGPKDPH